MSKPEKKIVRSLDYRVLFTDHFDIALNSQGVRLQVQQQDPDDFISALVGLQMSFGDALGLSDGIMQAIDYYEKQSGVKIDRPEVMVKEVKKS